MLMLLLLLLLLPTASATGCNDDDAGVSAYTTEGGASFVRTVENKVELLLAGVVCSVWPCGVGVVKELSARSTAQCCLRGGVRGPGRARASAGWHRGWPGDCGGWHWIRTLVGRRWPLASSNRGVRH